MNVKSIFGAALLALSTGASAALQIGQPAPTFSGEAMRFVARITGQSSNASTIELAVRRLVDGEITCQGSCRVET